MNNTWVKHAISEIEADFQRSADTHLIRLNLPTFPGIYLYLKDESTHPTGSLKHRLDQRRHDGHRSVLRQYGGLRSLFCSSVESAFHRRYALVHCT